LETGALVSATLEAAALVSAVPEGEKDALTRNTTALANNHVLTFNGNLNAELGLAIAPNEDILTVNGRDGKLVEITPDGTQIATKVISTMGTPPGAGCLFQLANTPNTKGAYFVDDSTNQLNLFK
jgi:hypothetical protein